MFKEFKAFAMKGNVMDMAIGIIIGAAFSTIVKSLVADVIMPPIGLLMGNVDFTDLFVVLKDGKELIKEGVTIAPPYETLAIAKEAGAVTLNYGAFINTIVSFLIVAFAVFMMVRSLNKMQKEEPPADPTEKECTHCCSKIPLKATRCPNCTSEVK